MKPGKAFCNNIVYTSTPDFYNDQNKGCTNSFDQSKASLIYVWKCPVCGYSIY